MIWLIGFGGAFGACARYYIAVYIAELERLQSFPFATLFVNIFGSFLFGMITQRYITGQLNPNVWYFLGIGFCGAFTTFSTFGYEVVQFIEQNKLRVALIYI